MRYFISLFLACLTAQAAATITTWSVGTMSVSGAVSPSTPAWTPDTFGSGANAFTLGDMVVIGDPGNAATTDGAGYTVGDVDYEFVIQKYEATEDVVTKATALGNLDITVSNLGTNKPASSLNPFEIFLFVNWLNKQAGYHVAYNVAPDGTWGLWDVADSWGADGGVTVNRYRHKDCLYFLPSWGELTKAARYDPGTDTWGQYYGNDVVTTGLEGWFKNGGTTTNTAIISQRFDARYPEWDSTNKIQVTLTTSSGNVTGVAFDSYLSGHNYQEDTETEFSIVQGANTSAKVTIATFQTIEHVPGTFTNYVGGTGYTDGPGTITLAGNTVDVQLYTVGGAVVGAIPLGGKFATEDYDTVLDIVQAGGSSATCKVLRYSSTTYDAPRVGATFVITDDGSGYSNGAATITSQPFDNALTEDPITGLAYTQICVGAADVDQAGGLSRFGVMGLGGNVSDWSDSAQDMTNDLAGTYPLHTRYYGGWWYRNASLVRYGGTDSASYTTVGAYGNGFRVARKKLDSDP